MPTLTTLAYKSTTMNNKRLLLSQRPKGLPTPDCWTMEEVPVPPLEDGQFLVQHHYISLDPAMRGWMNNARSYIPPVQIGEVMRAGSVGKVIDSKNPDFQQGDFVTGWGGVQQYAITDGKSWYKVDPNLAPLPTYIGTLGLTGMTAYFGLFEIGKAKEGDVVLVSAAAGAVGSVVGQIAKIKGCRVVGIAGGPEKCTYLTEELGFDAAVDYKDGNVKAAIRRACPDGIDVYFDNVGGELLDAALAQLRRHARVVICGAISQYNNTTPVRGPSNYMSLLVNRAVMEGFVVFDYSSQYEKASQEMAQWMAKGRLKSKEEIHEGLDNFYEAFLRLFSGEKLGKLVLKV